MPVRKDEIVIQTDQADADNFFNAEAYIDGQLRNHFNPRGTRPFTISISSLASGINKRVSERLIDMIIAKYGEAGWSVKFERDTVRNGSDDYLSFS